MTTPDTQAEWGGAAIDSPAERGLCLSAMGGAAIGAFAGAALGAESAGVIPALCGMVGAVSGSALAAAAWSALAGLWAGHADAPADADAHALAR